MHERLAPRPARSRQPDPPTRGLRGTGLAADDLYLLGHDDRSGKPVLQPRALGTGLAGALLAELMLPGWIALRPDSTVVITRNAPQDALRQHALLSQIAKEPGPQPLPSWLRFLSGSAARHVAGRLEQAGYLQHVRSRVPWSQDQYIPVNADWAIGPMLRVRSALDPAQPLTASAAVLTGLAVACGLGFRLSQYQAQLGRPVQDAVAQLGPGLRELIAQTRTAVDSAVLSHRT
jgi:Golgi phosphoprotein 3 (GPP34)